MCCFCSSLYIALDLLLLAFLLLICAALIALARRTVVHVGNQKSCVSTVSDRTVPLPTSVLC